MDINTNYQPFISNSIKMNQEEALKLDKKKLKNAAQGLEAEFFKIFLKESKKIMFKNEDKENKAPGKDVMTDFMLERLAEQMAKTSPMGISEMIIQDVEKRDSKSNMSNDGLEKLNNSID